MERNSRALVAALWPLTVGHLLAMLVVILPFSLLVALVQWQRPIQIGASLLVIGFGMVTARGQAFFTDFGIDLRQLGQGKRAFCRPCLDWSERRSHLAGAIGASLAKRGFELGWFARRRYTRALTISDPGREGLAEIFGIVLPP